MAERISLEQFAVLAKALKTTYPLDNFIPSKESLEIWYSMLQDLSYEQLTKAVRKHIQTSNRIPTIADLRTLASEAETDNMLNDLEAWGMVRKAINKGWYYYKEEFQKLPVEVQKAVGVDTNLREWSQLPVESIESVVQSQFLRTYRTVQNRQVSEKKLPVNQRTPILIMQQHKEEPLQIATESNEFTRADNLITETLNRLKSQNRRVK